MSSFMIFIDNNDRTSGAANSFSIQLSDFNLKQSAQVSVSLIEASFLNCEYPINSYNNTISFYEASSTATTYTATIPEGNYSVSTLTTALKTAMDAATGNAYVYTVSASTLTDQVTISTPLPGVFKLISPPDWLGVEMSSFEATVTGPYPMNLSGVEYVDLLCPTLINDNINLGPNTNSILKRIPVTVPYGSLVVYQASENDDAVQVDPLYLNNLRFQLRRPDGELYELNNQRLSLTIKCVTSY